ncbi:MAG: peptidylprolyl isomerase [Pseudomonadota bacterium]
MADGPGAHVEDKRYVIVTVRKMAVWLLAAWFVLAAAAATSAQSQFSPVIRVNDSAITAFELTQRTRLLTVLGATTGVEQIAREGLIEERLQQQAAAQQGISVAEEDVTLGLDEFAGRLGISADEFLGQLEQAGVQRASVEDFIRNGVLWREVLRSRFAARAQVSEDDVDRAIALTGSTGGARVLLSEIILPARTPQETAAAEARAAQFSEIQSFAAFAQTARDFSAAPSRADGGQIDWVELNALPPDLRAQLLALPPGGVTEPVQLQNAVAVFQLRDLQEVPPQRPDALAIDYAELRLPGGSRSEAQELAAQADTCDDLFGLARALSPDQLVREVLPIAQIPADIAAELAKLDRNEVSIDLVRDGTRLLLMMCGRTNEITEGLDRAEVRAQLRNQRIASYADGFLAELLADAVIVDLR